MTEEWRSSIEWWWSPYKIIYTHNQIIWLLNHIRGLRAGNWPAPDRNISGYTEWQFAQQGNRYKDYCRMTEGVAGNLERRLLKTGMDGAMAYLAYTCGCGYGEMARMFHITIDQAIENIDSAIRYCEGILTAREKEVGKTIPSDKPYQEWKLVQQTLHKKPIRAKNERV